MDWLVHDWVQIYPEGRRRSVHQNLSIGIDRIINRIAEVCSRSCSAAEEKIHKS